MSRRTLAFLFALAFAGVACGGPAPSTLTDPREILAQAILSLKEVKSFEMRGTLTGSVVVPQLGAGRLALDGTTISIAADVAAKKGKLAVDAPTLFNTSLETIVVDQVGYLRILGPFAALAGGDPTGKYVKLEASAGGFPAAAAAADTARAIDELKAALDRLPIAPTKQADERCGDADCYHVSLSVTGEQLSALGVTGIDLGGPFALAVDVWSRKADLRPAKLVLGVATGEQGNLTATFDVVYDGAVSIEAPPDDQVASP